MLIYHLILLFIVFKSLVGAIDTPDPLQNTNNRIDVFTQPFVNKGSNYDIYSPLGSSKPNQEKISVSKFGVKGDGKSDDYSNLQKAIDYAANRGAILQFTENAIYRFTKPLDIKCSIDGRNSQLLPDITNTRAITFSASELSIKNLKIESSKMLFVNVNGDNIEFEGCVIKGQSYFALVILNGDNSSFRSSSIINNFKGRQQFAFRSSTEINNFFVEDSRIYGGIYLSNTSPRKVGNYIFKNNEITVDYSHVKQEMNRQHDGFHFSGIDGIKIYDNNIFFKNVNRGFKFTDIERNNKTKLVSMFPTTNVDIKNNVIEANSNNGKQLFDFYDGTAIVNVEHNIIKSVGHTVLFEDKTASRLSKDRLLNLESNEIHFDFEILYYRGNYNTINNSKNVTLNVKNNKFTFTPSKIKSKMNRVIKAGNNVDVKLQYPFYVRNINTFTFANNTMTAGNNSHPFKNKYTLYIYDTQESTVNGNILSGGVLYNGDTANMLTFSDNIVKDIGLPNLIKTVKYKFREYPNFNIHNNTINYSGNNFRIQPDGNSSQRINNNKTLKLLN